MENFRGKVAIVTGGGPGIGDALVSALAGEGALVAFCDIANLEATEQQLSDLGAELLAATVDMDDRSAIDTFVDQVLERFARTFGELTHADFERITDGRAQETWPHRHLRRAGPGCAGPTPADRLHAHHPCRPEAERHRCALSIDG